MRYLTVDIINFAEFKGLVQAIDVLTNEVQFNIEHDGMDCMLIDRSHIQYMELVLKSEWFGTYKCKNNGKFLVDAEELKNVTRRIKDNAKVRIEFSENAVDFIVKDNGFTVLKLYRMDGEIDLPRPPEYNPDSEMNFNLTHLFNAYNLLKDTCEKVEFYFDGNHLMFGKDGEESKLYGKPWQGVPYFTRLSTKQLEPLMKTLKFSKRVTIQFGNNMPMKFKIQSGRRGGTGYFLIAPMIDDPEDCKDVCPGEVEGVCDECNGGE